MLLNSYVDLTVIVEKSGGYSDITRNVPCVCLHRMAADVSVWWEVVYGTAAGGTKFTQQHGYHYLNNIPTYTVLLDIDPQKTYDLNMH